MESKSKLLAEGLDACGRIVNQQRKLRYRKPLKGKALRTQAARWWNEALFRINVSLLNAGRPTMQCYVEQGGFKNAR